MCTGADSLLLALCNTWLCAVSSSLWCIWWPSCGTRVTCGNVAIFRSLWFSNVILCGSCNALSCLGRKCGVLHFLHLAGVLLESPSSCLCFNVMADGAADAARKRVRIGATAPCLRPCVAGQRRNKRDFWTIILRTVLPVYMLAFWLEVARCIVPKSLSHTGKCSKSLSVEITFVTLEICKYPDEPSPILRVSCLPSLLGGRRQFLPRPAWQCNQQSVRM